MHIELLIAAVCLLAEVAPIPPQNGAAANGAAASSAAPESVETRYARAQVQLAEANLNRVAQSNKRVARSVPASVVADYERDLAVAKTRLEQATANQASSGFKAWLQRAEAEQTAAETTWKNATAVNTRAAGSFDPLEVERFRLRAEVAKLQLERGQQLADSSHEFQLQWELDVLDNQVQRLKEESRRPSPPVVNVYPYWPW